MDDNRFLTPLETLPVELINHICSFLPKNQMSLYYPRRKRTIQLTEPDLLSLRATSRQMYYLTVGAFRDRYREAVRRREFPLVEGGLEDLLQMSKLPVLHELIEALRLVEGDYSFSHLGSTEPEMMLYKELRQDAYYEFARSPEAFHVLQHIFETLKLAPNLDTIVVSSGYYNVLAALNAAGFTEPIVTLELYPDWIKHDLDGLNLTRLPFLHLVKSVLIYFGGKYHKSGSAFPRHAMQLILNATENVEELAIEGCMLRPSCTECVDLFRLFFLTRTYPNIRILKLSYTSVDKKDLEKFLRANGTKLTQVYLSSTYLRSGSWKTIFRMLQNAGSLEYLFLDRLFEDSPDDMEYNRWTLLAIESHDGKAQALLSLMIERFKVGQFEVGRRGPIAKVDIPIEEGVSQVTYVTTQDAFGEMYVTDWE